MFNVSNTSLQVIRIFTINTYFNNFFLHHYNRFHFNFIDFIKKFFRLCHNIQLQIFQTYNVNFESNKLIRRTVKTYFTKSTEFDRLKFVKKNYLQSRQKIFFKHMNDYFHSLESKIYIFNRLLFLNKRFVEKN